MSYSRSLLDPVCVSGEREIFREREPADEREHERERANNMATPGFRISLQFALPPDHQCYGLTE